MRRAEAEKLLGGFATGTLTEAERRTLFEAALDHQDLFDALADEEALRELLADPGVRAHLLAALAPAPRKVVPFWRRPGLLGAAAGVLMASLAGLTWLRNPQAPPPVQPPAQQERTSPKVLPPPEVQSAAAPPAPSAPRARKAERPAPAAVLDLPGPVAPPPPPQEPPPALGAVPQAHQMVPDRAAPPVPAPAAAASAEGMAGAMKEAAPRPVAVPARRAKAAEGKAAEGMVRLMAAEVLPTWALVHRADGLTEVTVSAPEGASVILLRRGASGVRVQAAQPGTAVADGHARWRFLLRLEAGDALDLYLPAHPVADPAALPETGPVDGFRARIHPAAD